MEILSIRETQSTHDKTMDYIDELLDLFGAPPEIVPALDNAPATMAELNTEVSPAIASELIPHTGTGAQARARAIGQYVIQLDPQPVGGAFYGFKTADEAYTFAMTKAAAGRDVNERVDGSKPCRPFIDLDLQGRNPEEALWALDATRDAVRETLREFRAESDEVASYGYATPTKISYHIIAQGVHLHDGGALKVFAENVRARLPEGLRGAVDAIKSMKSFGLRIPGCPKLGDAARALCRVADEDADTGDWMIQDDMYRQLIGVATPPAIAGPVVELTGNALKIAERAAKDMPWFGPAESISVAGRPDIVADLDRLAPHHCKSCDRFHQNRRAFISVDKDGGAYLNCYDAKAGAPKLLAICVIAKMPLDEFDILQDAAKVSGRYNSEVIHNDGVKDLYIGSAWNTGKSVHNGKIITELLTHKPDAKVLIVSARKSLSAQMCKDLEAVNAVSYTKIKGMLNLGVNPVSIWQLESLKRVDSANVFDLILGDELNSMAEHTFGRDCNAPARAGMSTLRCLLEKAGRVIISDNDLTSAQVKAVQCIRAGRPAMVVRNEYQPWAGVPARIMTGAKGASAAEALLWARLNTQHAEREASQPWRGTIVACHSRKVADELATQAKARYGAALVKLYTGESCDFMKRTDFSDAATAWDGKLVVIYTGTVSVGVSANIEHFDEVYAFFRSGNAPAASSAQMLFRARQVKALTISYQGGASVYGLPRTRTALLKWATLAANRSAIPDEFRNDRTPTIKAPTASDPKELDTVMRTFEGQLWVNTSLEKFRSASDFVGRLTDILERAGITVSLLDEAPDAAETVTPDAGEAPGPSREDKMVDSLPAAIERKCQALDSERDRSELEKAGDRCLELANVYDVEPVAITAPWVEAHEFNADARRRLTRVISENTRGGDALQTTSEAEGCDLTVKLLAGLGHDVKTMRSGEVVSAEQLKDAFDTLGPAINASALRLYGDTNGSRRAKAAGSFKNQMATMRAPLKFIGLEATATYRTERDKKKSQNATGVTLTYIWDTFDIEPRPQFPGERTYKPNAVRPPARPATNEEIADMLAELYPSEAA